MSKLEEEMDGLRRLGDLLIPFNFPKGSQQGENDLAPLKKIFLEVDGYGVGIHYNKADYDSYFLETVQIFGGHIPFLPFNLVLKIARRVLGSSCLSYIELPQVDRKYYCWTVCLDRTGHPILPQYDVKTERASFEGFEYIYMHAHQFNFY